MKTLNGNQTQLIKEIEELRLQLQEANETFKVSIVEKDSNSEIQLQNDVIDKSINNFIE